MAVDSSIQRISRLTPLGAILAMIEARVSALPPQTAAVEAALGRTLAEDVVVSERPPRAIAMRDGFAVDAAAFADAGPYAPVHLSSTARRIDAGDVLPAGADAVLPFDAVVQRGDHNEVVAAVAAGEGILPAGGDASPHAPLRRGGERVRAIDVTVLRAAGIKEVAIRVPRINVVRGSFANSPVVDAALAMLLRVVIESGCFVADGSATLSDALAKEDFDAVIAIGGTGSGERDNAVQTLARVGRVEVHGIAVSPGESSAYGFVGERPVLLIPGRIDAALAVWLLIGRHLVAKLAGGKVETMPAMLPLKRKVASAIGLVELIPVDVAGGLAQPLASGYLSFEALARSDGWIAVPADSEGLQAYTLVAVEPWP